MRRFWLVSVIGVIALAVSAAIADSAVRRVSISSPVQAGRIASVTVVVSPRANCTIAVRTGSYVRTPRGLAPKTGGRITWRWQIRRDVRPGSSPVTVNCGTSGTLRTKYTILAAEPEIALVTATKSVCERAPARVLAKYKTELIPLLDRTLVAIREQYGEFDCAYGSNYYREGGPASYYLVSVSRGKAPCTFVVVARVIWIDGPPLAGYTGPMNETYSATCKSLRG